MQRLNDLVKAAMGFSADRGDQVQVVNVRFPDAEDGEGVAAASPLMGFDKNDIMRPVELAHAGLVAILILFFVIRPMIRGGATGGGGGGLRGADAGGGGAAAGAARPASSPPDGQMMTVDAATGQPAGPARSRASTRRSTSPASRAR